MRRFVVLVLSVLLLAPCARAVEKPRVIVLTDISMWTNDTGDGDGTQSLIRLLLYSNVLDLEGLVASSNLDLSQTVHPELIDAAISSYGSVRQNLLLHSPGYPLAERLVSLVKSGQPVAGSAVRVNDSIGRDRNTEASEAIIAAVDKDDPRPLWICAWGGTADLAQALWKVRDTRSEGDMLKFVSRLRVHAIGDRDATGPWLRENFPALHFILREAAFRGMYRGGNGSLLRPEWIDAYIRTGHGGLGERYPKYFGTDPWSKRFGSVLGIKESATPSFLALIPNGLNEPERAGLSSWGGRLQGPELRPVDSLAEPGPLDDPDPRIASVYRWRRAVQADFQARLDWCVKPFREANHAPQARIAGQAQRTVKPGKMLDLDASGSSDPDGHALHFEWRIDVPDADAAGCTLEGADTAHVRLNVPADATAGELPLLLIVRDEGEPALEGYARANVTIAP